MSTLSMSSPLQQVIPAPEAKVVEAMLAGVDKVTAVKAAGYTLNEANSKTLANHLWKKHVSANETVLEALHKHDITPDRIARKMSKLLDAQMPFRTKDGIIYHEDNTTQLKTVDMVHKLVGSFAPKTSITANFNFEEILNDLDDEDE